MTDIISVEKDCSTIQKKKVGNKPKYATEEERKEAIRKSNRESARRTRDKHLECLRRYYENNKEYVNERNRLYKQKKKEEIDEKLKRLERLEEIIKEHNIEV